MRLPLQLQLGYSRGFRPGPRGVRVGGRCSTTAPPWVWTTTAITTFDKYWPADYIVGKEIVRFHGIIWPAMLMSVGLPCPSTCTDTAGWSSTAARWAGPKGNVVDPYALSEIFGVDALRFFLLRTFPFGSDGNFSNSCSSAPSTPTWPTSWAIW